MGHEKTDRRRGTTKVALSALLATLLLVALTATAQAAPTHLRKESLDITPLNHACGVATDNKGDLYASSAGDSKVKVYNAAHTLLTEITDSNTPCGLAVTTEGTLYVSERATGEVVRFKPNAYPFAGTPTYGPREVIDSSTKAKGIAVDPTDNRLYVAEGTRVSTYDSAGNLGTNEVQTVSVTNATGGTFALEFEGKKTTPIKFDASAAELKTALEALSTIGAGNVEVTKPSQFSVAFTGKLGHTNVPALAADGSGLTGSGKQKVSVSETVESFNGHIAEGALSEASGVAAYAYTSGLRTDHYLWVADADGIAKDSLYLFAGTEIKTLELRRQVDGAATPDASFGFGPAGAYLAADSGNRNSKGECKVGEQACTAGHLFLYDAEHKALDEFDASGEYLDRTANAAFADAEPTAIAIERSGGANDGTLYVTAGAGTGAKALAFGPLKAPSRAVLAEPPTGLSHTLKGAKAVATDSHGDVYAGALNDAEIHIYGSKGEAITTIGDELKPADIAVDSVGNVYVLDEGEKGISTEFEVTYYTPSQYPPKAGTTYERREEPIAVAVDFPSDILKGIAINPGPGEGKDHLFVTGFAATHEYDSAENESELLDEEFASCVPSLSQSIAVNGANGNVYFGVNTGAMGLIYVVDKAGKCLLRFEHSGSANGKIGGNPYLAVDQSNGHVIEYDQTKTAREYDAAGSFVAEFGNFTEGLGNLTFRVAVDSSCAIHTDAEGNPEPLDETTTPTCKAYDPANGTAYVAFDDTSGSHPPYDVTAFGPLKYPPGNEKFALSVEKPGTGTGKVTSTPAGIDCGSTCSFEFEEGKVVELKAEASPGSEFVKWNRACSGTGICKVAITEAKTVEAEFKSTVKAKFKLTVSKAGSGSGKVTSSPAGIECPPTCSFEYEEGTEVTLTASPEAGSTFSGWSGSGCSGTGTCKVTMSSAKEVKATFTLETHLLSVTKNGTGTGTVTSSPAGINCDPECSASFNHGTTVTLTGTPGAKSKAVAWSGCTSVNGENKCLVTMTSAKAVTATFDLEPVAKFKLQVIVEGSGSGSVTSSPAVIECPPTCSAEFEEGVKVALTATPNAGSKFAGWSGACSGTGSCEVTMSEAKTVKATFTLEAHLLTVTKKGTGTGTVTSSPAGINCDPTCSASFNHGTTVTLTGTPGAKAKAVAWSGCTSVNVENKCLVTMTSAKAVTATFDLEPVAKYALKVKCTGTGSGTVSPVGCGSSAEYEEGTEVTLTAEAAVGSKFTGWSGSGCSGTGTCKVTMSGAKEVTATFDLEPTGPTNLRTLTLTKSAGGTTGTGSVSSKPKGINCAAACDKALARMYENATVVLKAKAATGSTIASWSGCESSTGVGGTEGTCTVEMDKDQAVELAWSGSSKAITEPKALTLDKGESEESRGKGTVKASGLYCEAECSETTVLYQGPTGVFPKNKPGKTVELKETPAFGSEFSGWSGACSGKAPTCKVTMEEAQSVTAEFAAKPITTLTIEKNSYESGTGSVTSKPKAINCGATCTTQSASVPTGEAIVLKEKPGTGMVFEGWSGGGCSGKAETCTVNLSEATKVKATFAGAPKAITEAKTLTLSKGEGSGLGTVKAAGLTCEALCSSATSLYAGPVLSPKFKAGKTVTLKASSAPGSGAVKWTGCDSNPTPSECVVAMETDKAITATFDELP